ASSRRALRPGCCSADRAAGRPRHGVSLRGGWRAPPGPGRRAPDAPVRLRPLLPIPWRCLINLVDDAAKVALVTTVTVLIVTEIWLLIDRRSRAAASLRRAWSH